MARGFHPDRRRETRVQATNILRPQISWGFGGETPITEEEAKPDDETKDLRRKPLR
jgi:hypothetical protein